MSSTVLNQVKQFAPFGRDILDYELLDYVIDKSHLENSVEKFEGIDGCLAFYSEQVFSPSKQDFQLFTVGYTKESGEWLISEWTMSGGPFYTAVKGGSYCSSLGWPWS